MHVFELLGLGTLFYLRRNLNKLSAEYQSYPETTKIVAFEQKYVYICHNTISSLYS